jgi:flagellar motor switch/type III secretory pathway protein FliN
LDERRVTDEELSALFEGGVAAAEPATGLPPHVVPPLASIAERLLVASFLDLDDFLDIPLEARDPRVAATPPEDLVRLAQGGAWAPFTVSGALRGNVWLVLPEVSVRRLLARLLGSRDDQVSGALGRLHRTSLEAPIEEVRSALARHLEDEELQAVVSCEPPAFEPPEAPEVDRLVRLECIYEMRECSITAAFYLEEELALQLAEVEQARLDELAPEEEPEPVDEPPPPEEPEPELAREPEAEAVREPAPEPEPELAREPEPVAPPEEARPRRTPELSSEPVTLRAYLGAVGLAGGVAGLEEGMLLRLDRVAGELVELRVGDAVVGEARVTVVDGNYGLEVRRLHAPGEHP